MGCAKVLTERIMNRLHWDTLLRLLKRAISSINVVTGLIVYMIYIALCIVEVAPLCMHDLGTVEESRIRVLWTFASQVIDAPRG